MGLVLESHSISRKLPKPIFKAVDTILQPASLVTMTLMKPFNLINKACFYKNSKSGYSYASHEASLNEIEADNSAYSNMAKVFKEGILKSTNPDLAQQLLKLNEDSRKINNQGHSKALISSLPFNRLHTKPKDQSKATFAEKVGQIDDEMYFFSTTQALQVIERNPDAFKTRKDTILSGIKLFKGYAQEHGAKRHVSQNFFGTFFPFNYNRYFKDPEYARYDNQGKLIDKEELSILGLEQVQPEQDENVDFNLSGQEEGQIIRNSKVTSIIRDDSLEEVYSLTTQYGEEHEDNQNDSCFDIIKNNLISNRLQNKQSHTEEDNFKDLLNDCCEIQPDNGPTQQ